MRLRNQVALVTGAGRGIGEAIAGAFAREGARVAVADVDAKSAAASARRLGAGDLRGERWGEGRIDRAGRVAVERGPWPCRSLPGSPPS